MMHVKVTAFKQPMRVQVGPATLQASIVEMAGQDATTGHWVTLCGDKLDGPTAKVFVPAESNLTILPGVVEQSDIDAVMATAPQAPGPNTRRVLAEQYGQNA